MRIVKANTRRNANGRASSRTLEYAPPPTPNYWDLLWTHRFAFTMSVVACVAVAALFTFSTTPVYQARGSLEIQIPRAPSYAREGEAAAQMYMQTFDSYLDTQIGILQSDTLIRRVISRLHLAVVLSPRRVRGPAALWAKYFNRNSAKMADAVANDAVFETVKKNLTVRQSRLDNLVEILYNANDPQLAASFVNTLAEEYEQQNLETRWQMSENAGNWFAKHLSDLRKQLENSETELQKYSRANGLLLVSDADKGSSVAKERLHQLQEELSKAQSERIMKQSQLEMSANSTPDAVPLILDNEANKVYQIKIADLERQMAEYSQLYTPTNPKVQMLQSQIASLQAALNKQRSSVLARLSNEYKAALQNEQMLSTEYGTQTELVTDQNEKMIRYETLKHEVDTNRATYEALLRKVKESSVSVALQATNVRVVDAAFPPVKPYKPNHLINLGGGVLAGLILGTTLVAVRHRSQPRVHRPGVMQHYMTTRELGVIPSETSSAPRRLGQMVRFRGMDSPGPRAWLGDPDSLLSASFRSAMMSIMFASKTPSRARFAVITSPGPGEGKTTVASNLAAAFAATGQRVLLVDADLRRPHIHKVFNLPDSPGLCDFAEELQSNGSGVELDRFVKATSVPDLFVITSGTSSSRGSNLLHTLRFEEVFAAFRQRFDTVLIDAPPLLAVPEVRVMARLADGVLLVVRAGETRLGDVMATEDYIREDGGTVIGTILNDAPQSSIPSYGGYLTTTV